MTYLERTEIKELHVQLNRDSIVEGWGDETPEILALMSKSLRLWYPNAEVMLGLVDGRQEVTVFGSDPTDFNPNANYQAIDEDIDAAYEFAVNHVYGAAA